MNTTASIIFDYRGRAKNGKPGSVDVRITIDRRSYYIATGVKVLPSEWRYGRVVNRYDCAELNERVGIVARKVEQELNACIQEGRTVNVDDIRRRVFAVREVSSRPLIDWIREQVPKLNTSSGTMRHYNTLIARLEEYGRLNRWEDLTVENLCEWDAWLHRLPARQSSADRLQKKPVGRVCDGTVWNHHKWLKAMLSRAERFGLIARNPYVSLRGQFKRGDKESVEYLTRDEMLLIEAVDVKGDARLEVARDLFIIQMYTGLSFSDLMKFDIRDYNKVSGRYVRVGTRVKTGVPFVSMLLPPVVAILKKYNWQIPMINNADYNRDLKIIGQAAKIDTRLHSHLARHTFATWMLSEGVPIESLSKMLGHTNITQTQRYAKVLAENIMSEFDKIYKKAK